MKKAFAALGGAVAAVLIVLVGVGTLYHAPTHDNWDMGTPMLTLAALLPAALFGAVIGFLLVDLVQARQRKAAGWVGGGGALLIVMIPVGIVLFPYIVRLLPSPPPSPTDVRAAWAHRIGVAPSALGAMLADELRRCIGEEGVPASGEALLAMGCEPERRRWLALGPEKLTKLGSYSDNDDGWRWQLTDSAGQRRLIVLPDPLLAQPGPTFEVRARETLRNDPPPPPPPPRPPRFNRDSTLLRLAHFRECIRTRAAGFRQAGTWSGLGESLPPLLETRQPEPAGCPAVGIYDVAEGPLRPWSLQVRDGDAYPIEVEYRAVFDGSVDTPFELSVVTAGAGHLVGYMIDRHGEWHERAGERPFADDPAPDPCMLDLSVPCH
jgi:hypothetical protein